MSNLWLKTDSGLAPVGGIGGGASFSNTVLEDRQDPMPGVFSGRLSIFQMAPLEVFCITMTLFGGSAVSFGAGEVLIADLTDRALPYTPGTSLRFVVGDSVGPNSVLLQLNNNPDDGTMSLVSGRAQSGISGMQGSCTYFGFPAAAAQRPAPA